MGAEPASFRVLVLATGHSLLWSVPATAALAILRAFLLPWLEPRKEGVIGSLVTEGGAVVLGFVVWLGIRNARRRGVVSRPIWPAALAWSFALSVALSVLYQVCFLAGTLLARHGMRGLSRLPAALSAWWPDPSAVGYPFFALTVLLTEAVVLLMVFVGSLSGFRGAAHTSRRPSTTAPTTNSSRP